MWTINVCFYRIYMYAYMIRVYDLNCYRCYHYDLLDSDSAVRCPRPCRCVLLPDLQVDCSSSYLTSVPSDLPPDIVELNLDGNIISTLHNASFTGCGKLKQLTHAQSYLLSRSLKKESLVNFVIFKGELFWPSKWPCGDLFFTQFFGLFSTSGIKNDLIYM